MATKKTATDTTQRKAAKVTTKRATTKGPKAPGSKTTSHSSYDASKIQVLKGLEAVRKRPGMYIGGTGSEGMHHLVWEIIDNSVDEYLAGECDRVEVTLHKDASSMTVEDPP